MITQRTEILNIINQIPDELLIDLKSILNNFLAHKKQESINSLTKEQLAYNNLQKFRRKGLTKCDYKKELSEALLKNMKILIDTNIWIA